MISLITLREELDMSPDRDRELQRLLARVVGKLERRTRRLWSARTAHSQIMNTPTRAEKIFAELYPITSVTSVKTWYSSYERSVDVDAFDTDSFDYDPENGIFWRVDGLSWAPKVELVTSGGYADDAAPADCLSAIVQQLKYELVRNSPQRIANTSQASRGGSSSSFLTKELHPEFEAFISMNRRFAR